MRLVTDAEETFSTQTFPMTTEEVIEEYGEMELELPNGNNNLGDVLSRCPDEEYEDPEAALEAAYGMLGEEAIGRKGYSDRDPRAPGEQDSEPLSL